MARILLGLLIAATSFGTADAASRATYPALETAMPAARTGAALPAVDIFKQTSPSIYLIVAAKDEATVKRYQPKRGRIELVAENPRYAPIVVDPDSSFRVLGTVRGVVRTV